MANLTPTPAVAPVPLLDSFTVATGGPSGTMNAQAQALLNWLAAWGNAADHAHGDALLPVVRQEAGAVPTDQDEVNSRFRCIFDFMSPAEKAAYKASSGAADHTAAIQLAIDAAGDNGTLIWPEGEAKITGTLTMDYDRQVWIGAGRGVTRLKFAPTANDTMIEVGKLAGISNAHAIVGLTITSADSTYEKTAIALYDTSCFVLRDVDITGSVTAGGTYAWTGGAGGSIGIRTYGREMTQVEGGCYISADNPIRISRNVHTFSPQIDSDFTTLRGLYMIAYGYPNVLIDGDVELTNFLMDGCPMVRGTHAIKWIGTSATRAASGFAVVNSRWEQPEVAANYALDIQPNQSLYNLALDGLKLPDGANGIRLRNVKGPALRCVSCGQNGSEVVLDVDSSVTHMTHTACLWGVGSVTATMAGQRVIWAGHKTVTAEALPSNAIYDSTSNAAYDLRHGGALAGFSVTLANNATSTVLGTMRGLFSITEDANAGTALFMLAGGAIKITDQVGSVYSVTATTGSKTNIYWNGSAYEIENKCGASRTYRIVPLGAMGSFT